MPVYFSNARMSLNDNALAKELAGDHFGGVGATIAVTSSMAVCSKRGHRRLHRRSDLFRIFKAAALLFFVVSAAAGQNQQPDWQAQIRKLAEQQDWTSAMRILEQEIARAPQDTDVLAWRARILTWSGHLTEAEAEYLKILKLSQRDPDIWLGLANVYMRESKTQEALRALDTAVELDPKRADLRSTRARALRAAGENKEARLEFQQAMVLDPRSIEARSGLRSFDSETKHELRFGEENDILNFVNANHDEWMNLLSRWTRRWVTDVGLNTYQRGGVEAGKFTGSVTARSPNWGSVTAGGAVAHDNTVIPKSEAFFDLDHGQRTSETGWMRGIEFAYGQHWYWYQTARILTLNGTTIVYLPRDWTISLTATAARSAFSGTGAEWRPSGSTRITFPLARWTDRRLSGNLFYAAGTEDFAQVDQIGSFASQTYGGGLRFQFTARQDLTGYASYQKRTQNRTDANFGFSYGIHF
jgi:tetratricopeptide (TPR) repeat protein